MYTPVIPNVLLMSLESDELLQLVEKAKDGDAEAIVSLYDTYAPDIYRYAVSITRDEDLAKDVVSESFLRAWTHLPSFKGGNFRAYLYTIARNYIFDVIRKDSKCTELTEEPEEEAIRGDVLKRAIRTENAEHLFAALQQLPDKYKEVVTLRFMEELTVKETAAVIGISEISVRVTQSRALSKLRKLLS